MEFVVVIILDDRKAKLKGVFEQPQPSLGAQ